MTHKSLTVQKKKRRLLGDLSFLTFFGIAVMAASLCCMRGMDLFFGGLRTSSSMLVDVVPRMISAFFMAGFIQVLLPGDVIQRWIGEKSGLKGIVIASLAGIVTPGGPMVSFPLITALYKLGADCGPLVSYITSWEILGLQRIVVWELPMLGPKFALLRFLVSFLLPVVAGLTARRIVPYVGYPSKAEGG